MLIGLVATGMSLGWDAAPASKAMPRPHVDVSVTLVADFPPTIAERADSPRKYDPFVREAASAFALDPALIRAVIEAESAFDPWAVSRAGAQRLMQLMPALSKELGVNDPFDPRQSISPSRRSKPYWAATQPE